MGRLLIIIGVVLIIIGVIMNYSSKIPWLGKLPGDIVVKREGFQLYFPIVTSIIISILLTMAFYIINKLRH